MADITTETRTVVQPVTQEMVVVALTTDEAATLAAILRAVGGLPEGYRGEIISLCNGLDEFVKDSEIRKRTKAIVGNYLPGRQDYAEKYRGAIYFADEK